MTRLFQWCAVAVPPSMRGTVTVSDLAECGPSMDDTDGATLCVIQCVFESCRMSASLSHRLSLSGLSKALL